jgi:hypothetical protein
MMMMMMTLLLLLIIMGRSAILNRPQPFIWHLDIQNSTFWA